MRMATTLELGMGGRKVKEMKGYRTKDVSEQRRRTGSSCVCKGEILLLGSRCLIYSLGWDLGAEEAMNACSSQGHCPAFLNGRIIYLR